MLRISENHEYLLTHALVPAGPIPTAHDPDGIYPYESFCETSRRPEIRGYRMISMENDLLRVKICPDLGGRVCSILLKKSATETLFFPRVIRPVRILPRYSFTGGGIELSFPISHSPVETIPVLYEVTRCDDRIYISCGEREIKYGMHWTVEYSLGANDPFLTQRTVFLNPGSEPHPWMSWSNAGVTALLDTIFDFPTGPVLVHDTRVRTIDWNTEGPRTQADVHRMTGFFWKHPDCCAFGVFTPSLSAGLYHVADARQTPGIKLWTDGTGRDREWVSQYTLDGAQCLEIQAGPLLDQSLKDTLAPEQQHVHTEFWIPSDSRRNIREIELPAPDLRPLIEIPLFSWAREEEIGEWLKLVSACRADEIRQAPQAPAIDSNRWAPSGISELGDALGWVISRTERVQRGRWLFQYGAWLAGRGDTRRALDTLSQSHDDRARALAGRLWRVCENDAQSAVESFRTIESEAIALHPQVVIERDKALAALGLETLNERSRWLQAVSALDDEWLAERRACLLLDCGDAQAACNLLRTTRFQLIHQRYERTRLWKRVESALGLQPIEYPSWLGEDDLAEFGAYREHLEISSDGTH